MNNKRIKILLISLFLLLKLNIYAQGDLLVTPYRVIFEDGKTFKEVSIANTGKDTARYVIDFVQYKMNENGVLEQIGDQDSNSYYFASKYLRIFPRSVILAPNDAQVVRLQVRTPPDIKPGEYRSHLYFRSVPIEKPLGIKKDEADSTLSVRLIPVYGLSIPVIIRIGNLNVNVNVKDAKLDLKEKPVLNITITRNGEKSTFGDIEVEYINKDNPPIKVGNIRSIAIYTPLNQRKISLPLNIDEKIDYKQGMLKISYVSSGSSKKETYFDYLYNLE